MSKTTFFAVAALLFAAASLRAQSLDQALGGALKTAKDASKTMAESRATAAAEASRVYPKSIACAQPPKEAYLPQTLKFYTNIPAAATPASLGDKPATLEKTPSPKDETASKLDDYGSQSFDKNVLAFNFWSCDTQDYFFTFPTADLARDPALKQASKPVKARVRIETRGHVDFEGALSCTASY